MSTFSSCLRTLLIGVLPLVTALPAAAQQGPPPVVREAIDATVRMIEGTDEASLRSYAETRLADAYRSRLGEGVLAHLQAIREGARDAADQLSVERVDDDLILRMSERRAASIRLRLDESTGRVGLIELMEAADGPGTDSPEGALAVRTRAIEDLGVAGGAGDFAREHLSPDLRSRLGAGLDPLLDSIADIAARAMNVTTAPDPDGVRISFRGGREADVVFDVTEAPPHLIASLRLEAAGSRPTAERAPLVWDDLPAALDRAEEEGFSGTVLAIDDGRVVVGQGYGMADRAAGRPNDLDTVFDIGSLPFDFTAAAILRLVETGDLDLDAPITRFFPDVPEDKTSMTVRHLLEHRSGLPNFHGRETDADLDLAWIDREEAERRILEGRLLFAPGEEREVSHSAFGLLAALVERVSGRPYGTFLREEFFTPAGMTRTGFYGDDLGLPTSEFAVGYGVQAADPNIPPNWGPTSWLVMGSGGMVSTASDLKRWFDYVRTSDVLTGERLEAFQRRPFVVGGSERGFLNAMAWDRGDREVYLLSNSGGPGTTTDDLVRGIIAMLGGRLPGA